MVERYQYPGEPGAEVSGGKEPISQNQCDAQTKFLVHQPSDVSSGGVLVVASFFPWW